jgi:hypothetical protein
MKKARNAIARDKQILAETERKKAHLKDEQKKIFMSIIHLITYDIPLLSDNVAIHLGRFFYISSFSQTICHLTADSVEKYRDELCEVLVAFIRSLKLSNTKVRIIAFSAEKVYIEVETDMAILDFLNGIIGYHLNVLFHLFYRPLY